MAILVGAYHVRVKVKRAEMFETLDAIGGSKDLLDFVSQVLNDCKNQQNDEAVGRVAQMQQIETTKRVIQGRIQVGDYGQACRVVDAADGATVFNKTKNHADLLPFFFRIEIPEQRNEALFLIEKSRKTSPKTAFTKLVHDAFSEKFDGYSLSIDPVMPEAVFREYLNKGKVQKISFIKMGLPNDIANILDGGHDEERGKTEFSVTASRNQFLPIKKSILTSPNPQKAIQDLYELTDLEYDNVKMNVRLGRNIRSLDLGARHTSPLYDISKEVQMDVDGIGEYRSMAAAFAKLASDINEGAYASA